MGAAIYAIHGPEYLNLTQQPANMARSGFAKNALIKYGQRIMQAKEQRGSHVM
jgi:hypothetical protein